MNRLGKNFEKLGPAISDIQKNKFKKKTLGNQK